MAKQGLQLLRGLRQSNMQRKLTLAKKLLAKLHFLTQEVMCLAHHTFLLYINSPSSSSEDLWTCGAAVFCLVPTCCLLHVEVGVRK